MAIDYAYLKEKNESWYDARDEWIKDVLEDTIHSIVAKINDQPNRYEVYTYKDVRELVKKLL